MGVFVASTRTSAAATFAAGVGLLFPASLGLLITGVPTKLCALPLLTILPAFVLSTWRLSDAAVLVPVLLFFVWHPGLFRGEARIPPRSYVLLAIVTVLSTVYFIASWKLGLQYQGAEYTRVVCIVNVAWAAVLVFAFGRTWKNGSSFKTSLFLHWMLFAWLASYAFPYLGELP
jgi:hypothetical protein